MGKQELIPAGELSAAEEKELDRLADHISKLEREANLSGLKLRLQQADDLIQAFKTLTGRTPFEAKEDSARQRFTGWLKEKHREKAVPWDDKTGWNFIHLHRFCERRPSALKAENISVQALIELSRPKLITGGKSGAEVNPEREKVVSNTFKKLAQRQTVTASDAKKTVYEDLEAANLPVYVAPTKPWTLDKAEQEIEKLVVRIAQGFKRRPEDREYLKRKLISEVENSL